MNKKTVVFVILAFIVLILGVINAILLVDEANKRPEIAGNLVEHESVFSEDEFTARIVERNADSVRVLAGHQGQEFYNTIYPDREPVLVFDGYFIVVFKNSNGEFIMQVYRY